MGHARHQRPPNPGDLARQCQEAAQNDGTKVFIAVAGRTPALPGAIAAHVRYRPVIGVALSSTTINARDTETAITRMPPGVPLAYGGADLDGLVNAAILACQMIAIGDREVGLLLQRYMSRKGKAPAFNLRNSTKEEPSA